MNTLSVLESVRFDKVHVAAYSPRPGTIAWRHMEDDVPQEEKMRRLHAVEELQERIARENNEAFLGATQDVLVEGEKDGTYTGRNRTNKLVHFSGGAMRRRSATWSTCASRRRRRGRCRGWLAVPAVVAAPRRALHKHRTNGSSAVIVVIFTVEAGSCRCC